MLTHMEKEKDIAASTDRDGDTNGAAARAFYKHLGFMKIDTFCSKCVPVRETSTALNVLS